MVLDVWGSVDRGGLQLKRGGFLIGIGDAGRNPPFV